MQPKMFVDSCSVADPDTASLLQPKSGRIVDKQYFGNSLNSIADADADQLVI